MKRNRILDVIKGLLIFLVVQGHCLQYGFGINYCNSDSFYDDFLFRAIYCFHMPLFMFISGYFFYFSNQKSLFQVISSKLLYIGVPFVVYCTIIYLCWFIINRIDTFYFSSYLWSFKNQMWFLSSLLLYCIIVSIVIKIFKASHIYSFIVLIVILLTSMVISDDIIPSTHKFVFAFFLLGYYLNTKCVEIFALLKQLYVLVTLTIFFVLSILIYDANLMVYKGGFCVVSDGRICFWQFYKDFVRIMIGVVTSSWFVVGVSYLIKKIAFVVPIFVHLGKHSLAIYGMQSILFYVLIEMASHCSWNFHHNYFYSFILCLCVLAICEFFIYICSLNRIIRLLFLGKK